MAFWNKSKPKNTNPTDQPIRVIQTARSVDSINKATRDGFFPLIRKVEPSPEIRSKYCVIQHKKTGMIQVLGDFRESNDEEGYETAIDWTFYYPHTFPSPFAAYLIPKDISVGEIVYVEDLIEDYIGASWNQGDKYRLKGCKAVWNGSDLDILYDPRTSRSDFVG